MPRKRTSPTTPKPERGYTGRSGHFRDRTGERVGRLVVIGWAGFLRRRSHWECLCDCGRSVTTDLLARRSCGCLRAEYAALGQQRGGQARRANSARHGSLGGPQGTISELAALFHVKQKTMAYRVKNWPPERWGLKPRGSFKFKNQKKEKK